MSLLEINIKVWDTKKNIIFFCSVDRDILTVDYNFGSLFRLHPVYPTTIKLSITITRTYKMYRYLHCKWWSSLKDM